MDDYIDIKKRHLSSGFTLVELMVTVAIAAILAAIAIPNYRSQTVLNAEHQARQRALGVMDELSRWRARRLTYAGFIPRNDGCTSNDYCYSNASTGTIYVPLGSTASTRNYSITVVDAQAVVTGTGDEETSTAVPLNATTGVSGKGWRMLVEPNTSKSIMASAHSYYLDSLGQRCQYEHGVELPDLSATTIECTGSGVSIW